jgi:thioesterase domain-containing protein/acyl carrier protein
LANGYLHQPQLTEERFLTLSISGRGSVRLYGTGDRAYYVPDGNLIYLGRRDDQVKVRGMRVELSEVRAVLAQHPSIEQIEVVVQHTHDEVSLVAYIVTRPDSAFDTAHLRRFAGEQLPSHMLPAHFVQLASLPLTPNGKVDRLRLPKPSLALETGALNAVAPRNDVESRLAAIWHTLLHQAPISMHTDFFAAGGHSLLAMHLFVKIEREFGVTLPLASIVQESTIEHLAQLITAQTEPNRWQSLVSIQPFGSHPPLFCVHGITGDVLWFRDLGRLLAPDQPLFGLQAPALDGIEAPSESVYTMAQSYVAEIRTQQPTGPYYLGGASFGGTVALEMAQQLVAAGDKVALLIQFDHAPHFNDQRDGGLAMLGNTTRLIRNVPHWLGSMREMDAERVKARMRRKALNALGRLSQMAHLAPERSVQSGNLIDYSDQLPPHRRLVIENHYRAISTYQPKPYGGNVLLLRANAQPLLSTIDSAARWRSLVGDKLQVRTVDGSHEGMFQEPHVQHLADAVRQALRQYP